VSEQAYEVVVTREDGHRLAEVPGRQGARTFARSRPALDQAVREVIVLAADLPDAAMPGLRLDFLYHTGDPDLDSTALEVGRLRRQADELAAAAAARTGEVAVQLVARGLSVTWPRCWPSARSTSPGSPPGPARRRGAGQGRQLLNVTALGAGRGTGRGTAALIALCIPCILSARMSHRCGQGTRGAGPCLW